MLELSLVALSLSKKKHIEWRFCITMLGIKVILNVPHFHLKEIRVYIFVVTDKTKLHWA